jgi:hypothetical protein
MSKIEVNQISSQCGSTLTIGQSGDTVTLACGASQTGFGRTGTVDWDTTAKTATFTAVSGEGYFCNTTSSAFTVNLPAGSAGAIVSLADYAATWQTNNLTVSPNGTDKIGSLNENAVLSTEGQSVTFVYVDSIQGWINTMDSTSNVRGLSFICASVSGACNTLVTAPCCANTKIATFTGPGTFTVNSLSNNPLYNQVSYLVVAGGGASGSNRGGGGGAGGFREDKSPVTPYTASPLEGAGAITVTATAFPITVGGGGNKVPTPDDTSVGGSGSNSIFSTITSTGGGGGGSRDKVAGANGGSGGGAGSSGPAGGPSTGGTGNTTPVSPPQGNNGGSGGRGSPLSGGMGGGGATFQGSPNNISVPSVPTTYGQSRGVNIAPSEGGAGVDGGQGATTSISSTPTGYAGGGGGGGSCSPGTWSPTNSNGGTGGMFGNPATGTGALFGAGNGGSGCGTAGDSGTTNTGGGGGGGSGGGGGGANGGSGIVIIRYKFQ